MYFQNNIIVVLFYYSFLIVFGVSEYNFFLVCFFCLQIFLLIAMTKKFFFCFIFFFGFKKIYARLFNLFRRADGWNCITVLFALLAQQICCLQAKTLHNLQHTHTHTHTLTLASKSTKQNQANKRKQITKYTMYHSFVVPPLFEILYIPKSVFVFGVAFGIE